MWRMLACSFFLVALAAAQTSLGRRGLTSTLMTLQGESRPSRRLVEQKLVAQLFSLSENSNRPSREEVTAFTNELTSGLQNRQFSASQIEPVSEAIVEVLHSSGVGASVFREAVDKAEKTLVAVGVSQVRSHQISSRLAEVGKSVRGPEDRPVMKDLK